MSTVLAHHADAKVFLTAAVDPEHARRTPVPRGKFNWYDFEREFAEEHRRGSCTQVKAEDIEDFDMAVWLIPDFFVCCLVNDGVVPFGEAEVFPPDIEGGNARLDDTVATYAAGFPECYRTDRLESGEHEIWLNVYPLAAACDPPGARPSAPFCLWVQTSWEDSAGNTSVVGISGGPVVSEFRGRNYLIGLVVSQLSSGSKKPSHVKIFKAPAVLQIVREDLSAMADRA